MNFGFIFLFACAIALLYIGIVRKQKILIIIGALFVARFLGVLLTLLIDFF